MKPYAFGADIGGTTIKIGCFKTDGELLQSFEIPTHTEDRGARILGDLAAAVHRLLSDRGIDKSEVEGIGAGVPGPVAPDGTVLCCVNLGWGEFNVERELESLTGLRARAGNDANLAALGEMWQGGGQGFRDLVMVTLGTGIGGGIILDGKIRAGVHGAAGELGHIPMMDDDPEPCGCGKRGCLEQYASATGILRIARRWLETHPTPSPLRDIHLDAREIFALARSGDAAALAIVDEACRLLGKALAGVTAVLDPEVIVVGGGMGKAGDILLDALSRHYRRYAFPACREIPFRQATLGNNAGIYGCARLILS